MNKQYTAVFSLNFNPHLPSVALARKALTNECLIVKGNGHEQSKPLGDHRFPDNHPPSYGNGDSMTC